MKILICSLVRSSRASPALSTIAGCNFRRPPARASPADRRRPAARVGHHRQRVSTTRSRGPASFSKTGSVDVSHSATLTFTVGALPAGTGYSIALTGASSDASPSRARALRRSTSRRTRRRPSRGSASTVTCRRRRVLVNGAINSCPVIDGVSASPASVFVGSTIALAGSAHDVDMGPAALTYQWTATVGTFDNALVAEPDLHVRCGRRADQITLIIPTAIHRRAAPRRAPSR